MKVSIFIVILILYILANCYIFHRLWTLIPPKLIWKIVVIALGVLTTFSWILSVALAGHLPTEAISFLAKLGSSWMFIALYLLIILGFQDLMLTLNKTGIVSDKFVTQFAHNNWLGTLMTLSFVALLMFGGYLRYNKKAREYLSLDFPQYTYIPEGDSIAIPKPLRIVAMSDLHLGYTIGADELNKWVKLVNKEKPDMVLIAGDLLDSSLKPVDNDSIVTALNRIVAPMGVYACLGNHEYISSTDYRPIKSFFQKANINLLKDEVFQVDSTLFIVGRDDKSNAHRKELLDLVSPLSPNSNVIVLDHQPFELEKAEEAKVNLQLSGHTHQGQIWPISLITHFLYELDHGYLKKGDTHIYVSSGIGIWGGKFRIGTESEYVVIDINQKETTE